MRDVTADADHRAVGTGSQRCVDGEICCQALADPAGVDGQTDREADGARLEVDLDVVQRRPVERRRRRSGVRRSAGP